MYSNKNLNPTLLLARTISYLSVAVLELFNDDIALWSVEMGR